MQLLTFILACYGMTMILVYSKIFEQTRNFLKSFNSEMLTYMLKCCMCMGFWVGVFNGLFFFDLETNWFVAGLISSGTSYFISRLVDDDGILIKIKNA
jgi:hypothetical protein